MKDKHEKSVREANITQQIEFDRIIQSGTEQVSLSTVSLLLELLSTALVVTELHFLCLLIHSLWEL